MTSQDGILPFPGSALCVWSSQCLEKTLPSRSLESFYRYALNTEYSFLWFVFLLCIPVLLLRLTFNNAFLFASFHGSFWVCFHFNMVSFREELHRALSSQIQVSEEWLVLNTHALREIRVECLVCCVSRNFDFLRVAVSVRGTRITYLVLFQLRVALPCEKPRK